jgi:hypothetical protein
VAHPVDANPGEKVVEVISIPDYAVGTRNLLNIREIRGAAALVPVILSGTIAGAAAGAEGWIFYGSCGHRVLRP